MDIFIKSLITLFLILILTLLFSPKIFRYIKSYLAKSLPEPISKNIKDTKPVRYIKIVTIALVVIFLLIGVWNTKRVDSSLTLKKIIYLVSSSISKLSIKDIIQEKSTLDIKIESSDGYAFTPREKQKIVMEGKKPYKILIENNNEFDLYDVNLTVQLPFLVEDWETITEEKINGLKFIPYYRFKFNGGSIEIKGRLRQNCYYLKINEINPGGKAILSILLDIDHTEQIMPATTAVRNYIEGKYYIKLNEEYIKNEVHYPIELKKHKSIYLGNASDKLPSTLTISCGWD